MHPVTRRLFWDCGIDFGQLGFDRFGWEIAWFDGFSAVPFHEIFVFFVNRVGHGVEEAFEARRAATVILGRLTFSIN